jgi:hypothetical protein
MNISAEVVRIRDLFGVTADLRVPPYQRGYAWTDKQTGALLEDLTEAFGASTVYFLGTLVVVQPRLKGHADVVDGQQRITSLTILLAVLRDLAVTSDEAVLLHSLIGQSQVFGERQRWRVMLNHLDAEFFRTHVQTRKATLDLDGMRRAAEAARSESQMRIAASVRLVHDALHDMSADERSAFAKWLLDEVSVSKVRVTGHEIAYKVFVALNQRGLPLSDHDIVKSALFERSGFTESELIEESRRWNAYAQRLGADDLEGMLKQIRFIYDRQMKGEYIAGLLHAIVPRMTVSEFVRRKLPAYVEAYEVLQKAGAGVVALPPATQRRLKLLGLIHHEAWRSVAIHFLVERPGDWERADIFFAALERLTYFLQYVIKDREYRQRRYRRVLDLMDNLKGKRLDPIFETASPLNLSEEERRTFRERLLGRFPNYKQRRALLMRIEAAAPGGRLLDSESDATVEHILPRAPPKGSEWYEEWSRSRDIEDLTECLGNYTLLTKAENQEADTQPFGEKIRIFFRRGQPSHALSEDLRGLGRWTPDEVRMRRDRMVGYLAQEWEI